MAESTDGFREVVIRPDGSIATRVLKRLRVRPGPTILTENDVVAVTGGGKGITAECALALAEKSGAQLILIGRSAPESDPRLAENLERFKARGVRHKYLQADVFDEQALTRGLTAALTELGPVTMLIHGAGHNEPRRLAEVTAAGLTLAQAPKLGGLQNMLASLDRNRLHTVIVFGSIIGRMGLQGEYEYAVANEGLRAAIEELAGESSSCRYLNIEWSLWSDVGMGERLGALQSLMRQGVVPIAPDVGAAFLCDLLAEDNLPSSIVVCGRVGKPVTLDFDRPPLPMLRFLESERIRYPGIEYVGEAELTHGVDPYLLDHQLDGIALVPAVFGLEAMAQAAVAIHPAHGAFSFEKVELRRPITVAATAPRTIQIAALAANGRTQLAVRSDETNFQTDHFRADVRFFVAPEQSALSPPVAEIEHEPDLDILGDLYGRMLFHGPRFQRIVRYRRISARRCTFDVRIEDARWFAQFLPDTLLLGDPGGRDSFIHGLQASIPHRRVLPVAVETIHFYGEANGLVTVTASERERQGDTFFWDLEVHDRDERCCERWEGLELRAIAELGPPPTWHRCLFAVLVERRVEELLSVQVSVALTLDRAARGSRARASAKALEIVAPGAAVLRRADGRPETNGKSDVSLAHAVPFTLGVASEHLVACDLEPVISERPWRDLLGPAGAELAEFVSKELGEPLASSATRIWTARESSRKAGSSALEPLVYEASTPDGWVVFRGGQETIASVVARISEESTPVAVAVAVGGET